MMTTKWRILLLDTKERNPNHYILIAIESALREHPSVEEVWSVAYSDALNTAIRHRCNLFIAWDGEGLDRGLCRRLAMTCGRSVLWVTEDPYENRTNVENAPLFDLVFTNDSGSVSAYPGQTHHLPFAAHPGFQFQQVPGKDEGHYLYDLLFVGTAWPNRVALVKSLFTDLKGIKVKVALPYNEYIPVPDLPLPESAYLWKTPNTELARMANRSRITLTLHRDFSGSGNRSVASTPGPRIFETALSGGFQLVDLSLPEVERYFTPGKEIGGFRSPEDCLSSIRHYLAQPEERLTMAQAAQQRCLSEHLYRRRVNRILEQAASIVPSKPTTSADRRNGSEKKIRVLYLVHNSLHVNFLGGVEVYTNLLIRNLPEVYEPYVYYPEVRDSEHKEMVLWDVRKDKEERLSFSNRFDMEMLYDGEKEGWLTQFLHERRIGLVHFQHILRHPWSLPLVPRTLGIPVVMTFADYYPVCCYHNLMNESKQYCHISELPAVTCDLCLQRQNGAVAGSQSKRRSYVAAVLENVDSIFFLCQDQREIIQSIYPVLKKHHDVRVEGYPVVDKPSPSAGRDDEPILRVAIPGNFYQTKGGDVLCRIFDALREEPVEFHLFGAIPPHYQESLKALNAPNVRLHGAYVADTLHEKLLTCDVALMLSIWPETYVLTLSESWRAALVPIVTNIGALGERVTDRVNGLKVPVGDPGSVVQALRELISDRTELKRMRSNIHRGLYRTLDDHLKIITGLYDQLIEQYRIQDRGETFFRDPPVSRPASASNVFCTGEFWLRKAVPIDKSFDGAGQEGSSGDGLKTSVVRSFRELIGKIRK